MPTKLPPRLPPPRLGQVPVPASRQGLIYWPAVVAAGGVSLLLLFGLLIWVAAHPAEARTVDAPVSPAAAVPAPPPAPSAETPRAEGPPAEAQVPDRHSHRNTSVRHAAGKRPTTERPAEEPKKAPPPEPKKEAAPPPGPRSARPAGETYGTSVLFLSNPDEAARLAREENKLLFVLHVSGNFEESCFT